MNGKEARVLIAQLVEAVREFDAEYRRLGATGLCPETEKVEGAVNSATIALFQALVNAEPTSVDVSMMFHGDDDPDYE